MQNVLLVTPWLDAASGGGTGTIVSSLCAELRKFLNVTFFIYGYQYKWRRSVIPGEEELEYGQLRSAYDERNPGKAFVACLLSLPKTLWLLRQMVRRHKIEVIHVHFLYDCLFYFRLSRWFGGPPYVVTLHGSDVNKMGERSWLSRWLSCFVVSGASRIVAVSDSLAEQAKKVFSTVPIQVIRNGVEFSPGHHIDNSAFKSIPRPFCLCAGGIIPVKGHDIAIRAWSIFCRARPDWHMVFAGDGVSRNECEKLAEFLGCAERIHWLGTVDRKDMASLMTAAEILILPSRNEGLPCVLLEAGSLALPVVASRVGGIPEVITDGFNGRLVSPEDADKLATVLLEMSQKKDQRTKFGKALQRTVRDQFSSMRMARDYIGVYKEVSCNRHD
jgi:glycosyltransferase involved in cell wall biosynthesis